MTGRTGNTGAALVIVVAILAILFAIGLAFFAISGMQVKMATNAANATRAELLADGARAIAIAFLNQDLAAHTTYTSLDHAWRTYFNGAWAYDKPWMHASLDSTRLRLEAGGIPEVNFTNIFDPPGATPRERTLLRNFEDLLYVPRGQDTGLLGFDPYDESPADFYDALAVFTQFSGFVIDPVRYANLHSGAPPLIPAERVDQWADVDSDDDGYKDAVWFPMQADVYFDDDGIDNDLDGVIDEPGETAVFVYWGGNDDIDNDGDGLVDEDDEEKLFLTSPLVDVYGDPIPSFNVKINTFDFQAFTGISLVGGLKTIDQSSDPEVVDRIDNDWDLFINEHEERFYTEDDPVPVGEADRLKDANLGLYLIAPEYYSGLGDVTFYASGEPVCELVGRAAVLIVDEAGKVNLNAAGGHTLDETTGDVLTGAIARTGATAYPEDPWTYLALGSLAAAAAGYAAYDVAYAGTYATSGPPVGTALGDYETRFLPDIGHVRAARAWQLRMGAPDGKSYQFNAAATVPYDANEFEGDVRFPGYAGVDDNGNALWLAFNGVDDDGDAYYYEHDGIDNDLNGETDEPGEGALVGVDEGFVPYDYDGDGDVEYAMLEGIDEPAEFQRYRPYRDIVAETDLVDNDGDTPETIDEIGELGDRVLKTRQQVKLVNEIAGERYNDLKNVITVHSSDKNVRRRLSDQAVTGLKLDYNYASAEDIDRMLVEDWGYNFNPLATTDLLGRSVANGPSVGVKNYFAGLRLGAADRLIPAYSNGIMNGVYESQNHDVRIAADPRLQAAQLAANTRDAADRDYARSEVTARVEPDPWWKQYQENFSADTDERAITYTAAGLEAIRINEVMVRPVRRVEAEATTESDGLGYDEDLDPTPPGTNAEVDLKEFFVSRGTLQDGDEVEQEAYALGTTGWAAYGSVIGDEAGWATSVAYLDGDDGTGGVPADVIQFRFKASSGLKAGRYYLLMNTAGPDGEPTVTASGQFQYAIKYYDPTGASATADDDTILDDIAAGDPVVWNDIRDDFLPMDSVEYRFAKDGDDNATGCVFLPSPGYRNPDHINALPGYELDEGHTVLVPGDPLELVIAIRKATADGDPLAINFFDFSQEPDHEWLELVNTSNESVPLDNWELVVGYSPDDPNAAIMRVPEDTTIAPFGMLLLGLNKYDDFRNNELYYPNNTPFPVHESDSLIYNNGIGLARGKVPLKAQGSASLPYRTDWYSEVSQPRIGVTPNVFRPGVRWPDFEDDGVISSYDQFFASLTESEQQTKAWDRIVELEVDAPDDFADITSLDDLAEVLFRGGVFPNYPEHDEYDNDGDRYILERDSVDNNLDDGDEVDEEGEGIDEGRHAESDHVPGSFGDDELAYRADFDLDGTTDTFSPGYLDLSNDPPEWKEFVERRWYPGDCVIVTLYQGPAVQGRIVDRITYTEHDVVNRTIDDDAKCVYPDAAKLNTTYVTFWPENSMALDFYKALERKHPFYPGDRFGFENRWQATDGNYDDWARTERVGPDGDVIDEPTPLEENIFARTLESEFSDANPELAWLVNTGRAKIRNRPYTSPGDLLRMPHLILKKRYRWSSGFDGVFILGSDLVDEDLKKYMLGWAQGRALRALITGMAVEPVMLTCAQADVTPTPPYIETVWDRDNNRLPIAWSPILLYELDGDRTVSEADFPYQLRYLLETPDDLPATLAGATGVNPRWPLERRAVMYVSRNSTTTGATGLDVISESESVFTWDGEDGLEDGEYDVYVVMTPPLDSFRGRVILHPDGEELFDTLPSALQEDTQGLVVDIECYSNRDGDGRRSAADAADSFGSLQAVSPDADGVIHYGIVRVQDNYLALRLTNRAAEGLLNRFSYVILAPQGRTPGRININTTETRVVNVGGIDSCFNTLYGMPGMLEPADIEAMIDDTGNPFETLDMALPDASFLTDDMGKYDVYPELGFFFRAYDLETRRPGPEINSTTGVEEHLDGRYYTGLGDLVVDPRLFEAVLEYQYPIGRASVADLDLLFTEVTGRFTRMANLTATRSDNFEIIVTAQSGYGVDRDGDGKINYRRDEFEVTAEKKTRTVYER